TARSLARSSAPDLDDGRSRSVGWTSSWPLPSSPRSRSSSTRSSEPAPSAGAVGVESLAGEAEVHSHEGKHHHGEGENGDGGGTLSRPAERDAGVQVAGVDDPGDERPGFFGIPTPEAPPRLVGPHSAHHDPHRQQRPSSDDHAI